MQYCILLKFVGDFPTRSCAHLTTHKFGEKIKNCLYGSSWALNDALNDAHSTKNQAKLSTYYFT